VNIINLEEVVIPVVMYTFILTWTNVVYFSLFQVSLLNHSETSASYDDEEAMVVCDAVLILGRYRSFGEHTISIFKA
jgi:hypothetical protein